MALAAGFLAALALVGASFLPLAGAAFVSAFFLEPLASFGASALDF